MTAPHPMPRTPQARYALAERMLKAAVLIHMAISDTDVAGLSRETGIARPRLSAWLKGDARGRKRPPAQLPKISLMALGDWCRAPFPPDWYDAPVGPASDAGARPVSENQTGGAS